MKKIKKANIQMNFSQNILKQKEFSLFDFLILPYGLPFP